MKSVVFQHWIARSLFDKWCTSEGPKPVGSMNVEAFTRRLESNYDKDLNYGRHKLAVIETYMMPHKKDKSLFTLVCLWISFLWFIISRWLLQVQLILDWWVFMTCGIVSQAPWPGNKKKKKNKQVKWLQHNLTLGRESPVIASVIGICSCLQKHLIHGCWKKVCGP